MRCSVQHLRGLSNTLAAGVLLGGVDNGEACLSIVSNCPRSQFALCKSQDRGLRTGREGLLELLGLVAVLEDKGVELAAAADLELDLLIGVLLHARSCKTPFNQSNVHNWTSNSSNPNLSVHARCLGNSQDQRFHLISCSFSNLHRPSFSRAKTYRKHPCGGRSR